MTGCRRHRSRRMMTGCRRHLSCQMMTGCRRHRLSNDDGVPKASLSSDDGRVPLAPNDGGVPKASLAPNHLKL
ncbi:unnamed protein product [Prunus armeniaca]